MKPKSTGLRPLAAASRRPEPLLAVRIEALESRVLMSAVAPAASIGGNVYNDLDANGKKGRGDVGLAGWEIYVDANNNGQLDSGEASAVSDSEGHWLISGLSAGTYIVREVLQDNWRQTGPAAGAFTIRVGPHSHVANRNFLDTQAASVSGTVFLDSNSSGTQDTGEIGLRGCKLFVDSNNNGVLDRGELTAVTGPTGAYTFRAIQPGTVTIRGILKHGYSFTSPTSGALTITLAPNQVSTGNNFGLLKSAPPTPNPNPGPGNPPPVNDGGFLLSSTRTAWSVDPSKDIVRFFALDTGAGDLAGSSRLVAEDGTLSSPGGLIIRAYDSEHSGTADDADFTGANVTPTASFISLGSGFFVVSTTPSPTDNSYHDMQSIGQFEVQGGLIGGVAATGGAGAQIAVAIVPHGSAVSLTGQLGADVGPAVPISVTA